MVKVWKKKRNDKKENREQEYETRIDYTYTKTQTVKNLEREIQDKEDEIIRLELEKTELENDLKEIKKL